MKRIFSLCALIFLFSFCLFLPRLNADSKLPTNESEPTISMDFKDADLKDVLKLLSIQSGLNFIASEAVETRKITLYLDKVNFNDAMDKLFKVNNLSYELDKDSRIFIVKDMGKPKVDTVTRVFYLKYTSVSSANLLNEVSSNLGSSGTTGASTGSSSSASSGIVAIVGKMLSANGTICEDPRTNSLIVDDIPSRMPVIAQTIAAIDVPVPQIMIEVEMLDVSKNAVDKIGFKFGQTPFTAVLTGASIPMGFPFQSWAKTFVTDTARGSLAINSANTYSVQLDFLRTLTDTKILARPRILTLNNQTAEIKITTQETVGTVTTTSTGGGESPITTVSSERMETGVSLRVTPQANIETGEITMFILPSVKDTTTTTLSGITAKDPEERTTKSIVRINDGDTVVIGGLIRNQFSEVITKLPLLGDLPLIGRFFRHKSKEPDKERELLVFITPHILKDTDIKLAQIKKSDKLAEREQDTVSGIDRQAVINESLSGFEKKKK